MYWSPPYQRAGGRIHAVDFDDPPTPVNGEMPVPTEPGLGLKFAPDLFDKCGIG
jgi:hypothetical protein